MKTPCAACPFRRSVTPGALGGSSPFTYVGQAFAAFWLPCHSHMNYTDPVERNDRAKPQCAGAAIYRANTGVAPRIAGVTDQDGLTLHALPADTTLVFATPAEFLSHHCGVPLGLAEMGLLMCPPEVLLREELLTLKRKQQDA